jgi:hypothetical protein
MLHQPIGIDPIALTATFTLPGRQRTNTQRERLSSTATAQMSEMPAAAERLHSAIGNQVPAAPRRTGAQRSRPTRSACRSPERSRRSLPPTSAGAAELRGLLHDATPMTDTGRKRIVRCGQNSTSNRLPHQRVLQFLRSVWRRLEKVVQRAVIVVLASPGSASMFRSS